MSLNIDAYRQMGNRGISQLALLPSGNDGQKRIGSASESGVGFLKRLFNTSASKAINKAVVQDFKAALISAYDHAIAEEVFSAVIGKSGLTGAKLSSTLVSRAIDMADRIRISRLAPPPTNEMMLTMHFEGTGTQFNLSTLSDESKKTMFDAKRSLSVLHELLMDMPTDMLALQEFTTRINDAKVKAQALINQLPNIAGTERVIAALQKAISMVDGKITEATDVCNNNPVTYKALSEFTDKCIEGARRALSNLPDNGGAYALNNDTRGRMIYSLRNLTKDDGFLKTLADSINPQSHLFSNASAEHKAEIRKVIPEMPNGASMNDSCPDPKAFIGKDFIKKLAKYCTAMVIQDMKANMLNGQMAFEESNFTKDIQDAIRKELGKILNEGSWNTITKDVTFSLDGQALKGQSVITPASQMGGPMAAQYNDGTRGVNCSSFGETKHAVNLAHSEFKVEVNGQPKTVFSGIRHGVHAAIEVEAPQEFKQANVNRAKETIIAAFTSNQALIRKALSSQDKSCSFMFNSVSLLTPDFARSLFGSKHENEKAMLKAQVEAYRSINGQPIQVQVPDPDNEGEMVTVTIRPDITMFNYGVNWGGVGCLSSLFGGWGQSKDMNAQSLRTLNTNANATLRDLQSQIDNAANPEEKKSLQTKANAINTLLRQINSIDQSKTYSSDGHEAYKMASRIAVLTHLLGGVPAWNCKSGKDRTGMMDVECKFIATLAALGKDIPEPGAILTSEQKFLYRNLLLQSGNHEMQKYNTGVAGYKLEGVGSITERIGDLASQKMFLGASKIVNS